MSELQITDFGFRWGECSVERTASSKKAPKFQVIRIMTPNWELIEITMRPRSNHIERFPRTKIKK